jgi:dipeptidase D
MGCPITEKVLACFKEIAAVPRRSKSEEKIRAWLLDWAKKHNLEAKTDEVGNVLIEVPATPGYENSPILILQGHMDMVCEKNHDSKHDFTKDPIEVIEDGEWLRANGTTLGADNGIGVALGLVFALEPEHPALELLFTVDEETGLTGAQSLKPGFLKGKVLLNCDSEDEGVFTVGCAGGIDTHITIPMTKVAAPAEFKAYRLQVSGLCGGHSGTDINCQRANAIRVLARALRQVDSVGNFMIADIHSGSAHNAIPRDGYAVVLMEEKTAEKSQELLKTLDDQLSDEYKNTDPNLEISLVATEAVSEAMSVDDTKKLIYFLHAIPHGVDSMSTDIVTLVETSNNLAVIKIVDNKIEIITSQRSSVMSRLHALTDRIETIAHLAGFDVKSGSGYPSWQPNMASPLLAKCKKVYEEVMEKEPVVEVIHAGLECGLIGGQYPGMDMISFGPTIKSPHSPDEKMNIPSLEKVCKFMVALLKSYKA